MPYTEKQKKFVKIFTANIGNDKPKSLKQMMLDAGYSENSALQQMNILNRVKDKMKPVVDRLKIEREEILKAMETKRGSADYAGLVRGLDITTKNIQLLGGNATENIKIEWANENNNSI